MMYFNKNSHLMLSYAGKSSKVPITWVSIVNGCELPGDSVAFLSFGNAQSDTGSGDTGF